MISVETVHAPSHISMFRRCLYLIFRVLDGACTVSTHDADDYLFKI